MSKHSTEELRKSHMLADTAAIVSGITTIGPAAVSRLKKTFHGPHRSAAYGILFSSVAAVLGAIGWKTMRAREEREKHST
jgi:ribosomal protein L34E